MQMISFTGLFKNVGITLGSILVFLLNYFLGESSNNFPLSIWNPREVINFCQHLKAKNNASKNYNHYRIFMFQSFMYQTNCLSFANISPLICCFFLLIVKFLLLFEVFRWPYFISFYIVSEIFHLAFEFAACVCLGFDFVITNVKCLWVANMYLVFIYVKNIMKIWYLSLYLHLPF